MKEALAEGEWGAHSLIVNLGILTAIKQSFLPGVEISLPGFLQPKHILNPYSIPVSSHTE